MRGFIFWLPRSSDQQRLRGGPVPATLTDFSSICGPKIPEDEGKGHLESLAVFAEIVAGLDEIT